VKLANRLRELPGDPCIIARLHPAAHAAGSPHCDTMAYIQQVIVFDAVGTLIHCEPPAAQVYAEVARRFDSRLSLEDISRRFRQAFGRQEEIDRSQDWLTDEGREYQRWRAIVAETLDDVSDGEATFRALYDHFARPEAWRLDADAPGLIRQLREQRRCVALASNFDHRLRPILHGLIELPSLAQLFISSELGWRKPAPAFFKMIADGLGVPKSALLFVGDDLSNDYHGARDAGYTAVLLDPMNRHPQLGQDRVERLGDLGRRFA